MDGTCIESKNRITEFLSVPIEIHRVTGHSYLFSLSLRETGSTPEFRLQYQNFLGEST